MYNVHDLKLSRKLERDFGVAKIRTVEMNENRLNIIVCYFIHQM